MEVCALFFTHSKVGRAPTLKERLIAHGAEVIDPLRETPFDRFFFRDPNGYLFEVLEQERGQEDLTK